MITVDNKKLKVGDKVKIVMETWNGQITITEGMVQYKENDISSYGAGWGIMDEQGRFTFFSNVAKGSTKLILIDN